MKRTYMIAEHIHDMTYVPGNPFQSELRKKIIDFVKAWTLPVSMIAGFAAYMIYSHLHFLDHTHAFAEKFISIMQPGLIFAMLFITFCKVDPKSLRLTRWHLWIGLIQLGIFGALSSLLLLFPATHMRVIIESAMICMIAPTATAAVVIADKLGGNPASLTSYTIIANVMTAIVAPIVFPMVHPVEGQTFTNTFGLILAKVFPLLICPFFVAWLVRAMFPTFHKKILATKDLAFYLWAVALATAIAVTTRALMHSQTPIVYEIAIAAVSLFFCLMQFQLGRMVGGRYGDKITTGQALGQKNTPLAIWMGYTFLSPITALAGGFYSVWHNTVNSYQLYKKKQEEGAK